ncbi:MAG TPA: bifunctional anthranilate synthase component I family protein/class IV aminotransferase, partial [Longimicrobiales bacterium]|nr:bifunctional anthranilate synthase component I family protein/class IV aminotransferase [Longimicrobiales bacterium]
VSASPELFFRTRDGVIEARPMKGTRARGRWPAEDRALADALLASEKERAENLMIVDLLRSDLGRVARTGSVEVPRLLEVERYRTVHQMTSTIRARLRPGTTLTELFTALFPCGSVTGAPKISTMELIAALEESPREVYCGAIGLAGPEGEATFSVPIRTAWIDHGRGAAEYGVGSAITWDSGADAEHAELLAKAAVLEERWPRFALLETMRMEEGRVRRLERHLARLAASADYFGFPFPAAGVHGALEALGRRHPTAPRRVRLTLGRDGEFDLEDEALARVGTSAPGPPGPPASLPEVALAQRPVHSRDRFLYHKTTHRAPYEAARAGRFDAVLWNERAEATEMTLGNLVVELAGRRVTPPLDAGLLPGCFRAELLERGEAEEAVVTLEALRAAPRLWRINSVREWEEVRLAE